MSIEQIDFYSGPRSSTRSTEAADHTVEDARILAGNPGRDKDRRQADVLASQDAGERHWIDAGLGLADYGRRCTSQR